MKGLIDTHAHLDFPDFKNDLEDILERARQSGVEKIISIGTCLESSRNALSLSDKYPQIRAAVGIHPCYVEEASTESLEKLPALLTHSKVAAIGECGLDYHHLPVRLESESDQDYDSRWKALKSKQAFFFQKTIGTCRTEPFECGGTPT